MANSLVLLLNKSQSIFFCFRRWSTQVISAEISKNCLSSAALKSRCGGDSSKWDLGKATLENNFVQWDEVFQILLFNPFFLKAHFYSFVWKYKMKHEIPQTRTSSSWNEGDPTSLHLPKGRAGTTLPAFIPSWFNTKPHREKPSPLGPRNLRGEVGLGTVPGKSLQETMDVLRDRRKGRRKNIKNILSVIWLFFCEGGEIHNFTDQNSSRN